MSALRSVLFVHPALAFSSGTERLRCATEHLVGRGVQVTVLAGDGARADELRATGAEVLPGEPPTGGLRGWFVAGRARRLAQTVKADLVHVTSETLAPLAARIGRPYVLEVERAVREPLAWHPLHLRAAILPCRTLEESAVNRGSLPRERLHVLRHNPHPVPQDPVTQHPVTQRPAAASTRPLEHGTKSTGEHPLEAEPPRVGCAGYLTPDFGARIFLDAASHLIARGVEGRFLILGEGPEEEALRRRTRELAITERVTITAPAAPATADVLAQLDLFACPRLDGAPGWFAHQALELGLPCVVSSIQGAFELVCDGEDGVLVERGDAADLAEALEGLMSDPKRARTLGLAARTRRLAAAREEPPFGEALDALYSAVLETATV